MNIKKNTLMAVFGAVLVACASCSDEVPPIPASELYTREFVKTFGVMSPSQDWNAASRGSVSVTTDAPARVQVSAKIRGKNYLLANYSDVSGTRDIRFDVPKGVKEVTVQCGTEKVKTTLGGKVSFANTGRTVPGTGSTEITAEICTDQKDWWVLPMLNATIFRRKMPEGVYNANREGVSVDFVMKFAKNDIIVRPLFWQTNQTNQFGFFYLDENGQPVHCPIYDMDKSTEFTDQNVLGYCQAETRVLKIDNYEEDADFMKCLADNGVSSKDWNCWGTIYHVLDLSAQDNFNKACSGIDDHNMTMACRQYLDMKGIKHDSSLDIDHRFNYVYRWRITGSNTVYNPDVNDSNYQPGMPPGNIIVDKGFEIVYTVFNPDFANAKGFGSNDNMLANVTMNDDNYPGLITKGIKVHIEDITREYGAYIKRGDGRYLYSMSSLNEKNRWAPKEGAERTQQFGDAMDYAASDMEIVEGKKAFRAVTWLGTKYNWRYMSFEDGVVPETEYNRSSCDFDMQDFVFVLDGVDVDDPVDEVIDPDKPEPIKWLIACEDLGNKDDFDFNDVVFEVEYVAGEKTAKITPLAAGGTLETYLMRNDEVISPEWHSLFGVAFSQMVNTNAYTVKAEPFTIDVPEDFSIASPAGPEGYRDNMGGFHIKVYEDGKEERTVTPPGVGEAPQMILIFQPEGKPWRWPLERHSIGIAFDGFQKWMEDGVFDANTEGGNWSENHNEPHVIIR